MSADSITEQDSTVWQSELLRLTVFPSPSNAKVNSSWWSELLGQAPDTEVSRPRLGTTRVEGPFGNGKLVLDIKPTRIDWLFVPINLEDDEVGEFPTIGLFDKALPLFSELMNRWFGLESCPVVQRLAFGAVLVQPVSDRKVGYQRIAQYLSSVQLDTDNSHDFAYQINRPRLSQSSIAANLRVNRLMKWSVVALSVKQVSMDGESLIVQAEKPAFACRLELDINTTQDFSGEITRYQMPQLFEELLSLGQEIAANGDIP